MLCQLGLYHCFFPNHFYCCVLPHVFITTRVNLELKSPACIATCFYYHSNKLRAQVAGHGNTVQLMFAAIGERPELLGCALRRLAVVGPVS